MYVCTFVLCGYVTVDAAVILAGRTVLDQNGADILLKTTAFAQISDPTQRIASITKLTT